jgi:hypothetical protein
LKGQRKTTENNPTSFGLTLRIFSLGKRGERRSEVVYCF